MFLIDMAFDDPARIPAELTDKHRQYLADKYVDGTLIVGGPKVPRTGGLIISMHADRTDLTQLMQNDPLVQAGLASYSVTEFVPAMATKDYASLLEAAR